MKSSNELKQKLKDINSVFTDETLDLLFGYFVCKVTESSKSLKDDTNFQNYLTKLTIIDIPKDCPVYTMPSYHISEEKNKKLIPVQFC